MYSEYVDDPNGVPLTRRSPAHLGRVDDHADACRFFWVDKKAKQMSDDTESGDLTFVRCDVLAMCRQTTQVETIESGKGNVCDGFPFLSCQNVR